MHGPALTAQECVETMLSYYDRLEKEGAESRIAARLTGKHFGIDPVRVNYFIDKRFALEREYDDDRPHPDDGKNMPDMTVGGVLAHKNRRLEQQRLAG